MTKILSLFLLTFTLCTQVFAVEIKVERNKKSLGDGKKYILHFDGNPDMNATLVTRVLACYEEFTPDDKTAFTNLIEMSVEELRQYRDQIRENPGNPGVITLDPVAPHQHFIDGALKNCLH